MSKGRKPGSRPDARNGGGKPTRNDRPGKDGRDASKAGSNKPGKPTAGRAGAAREAKAAQDRASFQRRQNAQDARSDKPIRTDKAIGPNQADSTDRVENGGMQQREDTQRQHAQRQTPQSQDGNAPRRYSAPRSMRNTERGTEQTSAPQSEGPPIGRPASRTSLQNRNRPERSGDDQRPERRREPNPERNPERNLERGPGRSRDHSSNRRPDRRPDPRPDRPIEGPRSDRRVRSAGPSQPDSAPSRQHRNNGETGAQAPLPRSQTDDGSEKVQSPMPQPPAAKPMLDDSRDRSDPNQGNFRGRKQARVPRSSGVTKPSFRQRLAAEAAAKAAALPPRKTDRSSARKPASIIPDQSGLAARMAAVDLISSVLDEKRMLDDTLSRSLACGGTLAALEPRDRALARLIAATTLRRLGQIDDAVLRFLDRGFPARTGVYPHVLRAAVAQLMFLDTPAHAAINIAVSQAKLDARSRPFGALTNAVLRRVVDNKDAVLASQDPIALNTPAWMLQRWSETYGVETARQIAETHLHEAPLDLTTRADAAAWAERLAGRLLPTGSVRLDQRGRIEDIEGYDAGEWWVQDAAAAIPARLLGDVKGQRIADICAAPGGKTVQLANAGADVTAIDSSINRLDRLRANLSRMKLHANLVAADASAWATTEIFTAILLDAPCSATGTIRRHPDIPHLKSAEDLPALIDLQGRILRNVIRFLAPGGTLVYCTCSLEAEEGPDQIHDLLARDPSLQIAPIDPAEIGADPSWITAEGFLRTLPVHLPDPEPRLSGLDGFFAARIKRLPGAEAQPD